MSVSRDFCPQRSVNTVLGNSRKRIQYRKVSSRTTVLMWLNLGLKNWPDMQQLEKDLRCVWETCIESLYIISFFNRIYKYQIIYPYYCHASLLAPWPCTTVFFDAISVMLSEPNVVDHFKTSDNLSSTRELLCCWIFRSAQGALNGDAHVMLTQQKSCYICRFVLWNYWSFHTPLVGRTLFKKRWW